MSDYDGGYKKIFSHPEPVENLLTGFVREEWIEHLDFKSLEKVNASYVGDDLERRYDDVVWKVRFADQWLYVYILLEFQSSIDQFMSVRMMAYVALLYQDLIEGKQLTKNGKLPPVLPIVLYNGDQRWNAATEVFDIIENIPGRLANYSPRLKHILIDEGAYEETELASMKNLVSLLFQMEKTRSDDVADDLLFQFAEFVWERTELKRAFAVFLKRVYFMSDEEIERLLDAKDPGEFRMMYEKRREEMIQRAESRGRAEGKAEGVRNVAKNMLSAGVPISQVSEFTNLSVEELEKIRESIAN